MILCLDLETTALDEQRGGLLQIGACWLHSGEGFFRECAPNDANALVEDDALKVNGIDRGTIWSSGRLPENLAVIEFLGWARGAQATNEKIQIAAWNAHFDHRHLHAALSRAGVNGRHRPFAHRLLDLHSILAAQQIKWSIDQRERNSQFYETNGFHVFGNEVANCDAASKILGLPEEPKPHNALAGARQARAMLRRLLGDPGALP